MLACTGDASQAAMHFPMLKIIFRILGFILLFVSLLTITAFAYVWWADSHVPAELTTPEQIRHYKFLARDHFFLAYYPSLLALFILLASLVAFKPRPLTFTVAGCFSVLFFFITPPQVRAIIERDHLKHPERYGNASIPIAPSAESPQQRAIRLYPALADAHSRLNLEFVRRYQEYKKEKPAYFNDPEWPTKLATESDLALQHR